MKISAEGLEFIAKWEGLRLRAYKDVGGRWTIGYGSTSIIIVEGFEITKEEAEKLLVKDIERTEKMLDRYIEGIELTEGQYLALVSFVFNLGIGNFSKSTLLKYLLSARMEEAADEFLKWKYVHRKFVQGLYNRRVEERELFLS